MPAAAHHEYAPGVIAADGMAVGDQIDFACDCRQRARVSVISLVSVISSAPPLPAVRQYCPGLSVLAAVMASARVQSPLTLNSAGRGVSVAVGVEVGVLVIVGVFVMVAVAAVTPSGFS